MDKKRDAERECPLFAGFSDGERAAALALLDARRETYAKGAMPRGLAERMPRFGLVTAGTVYICRDTAEGEHILMAAVTAGQTFGESLAYLGRRAQVYPEAAVRCEILWMDPACLREPARDAMEARLQRNFVGMLAERTLRMNERIQIMSKKTLRAKIEALLDEYDPGRSGTIFALPFDRAGMAFFLGADRSALSRELSRMKREGLIDYDKNSFCRKSAARSDT